MKNITVSVDDETYRRSCAVATSRGTSVSDLVREFLVRLTSDLEERGDWAAVWDAVDAWEAEVGERPTRDRTYEGRA